MIRFLLRIALATAMPLLILSPRPGHAAAPAPVQMDHNSVRTIGTDGVPGRGRGVPGGLMPANGGR